MTPTANAGGAGVWCVTVDSSAISRRFGEYLDAFAACGRGETDTALLLASYGVAVAHYRRRVFALTSDDQVGSAVQQQVDGMRAAGWARR